MLYSMKTAEGTMYFTKEENFSKLAGEVEAKYKSPV